MGSLSKIKKIAVLILSVLVLLIGYIFLKFKKSNDIIIENASAAQIALNQEKSKTEPKPDTETKTETKIIEEVEKPKKSIMVHVSGKVKSPGVISILEGSRVNDAVQRCGGILRDADVEKVNLAEIVYDGQKIHIPQIGEVKQSAGKSEKPEKSTGVVNINSATVSQLDGLPEIGPSTARRIIDYRNTKGPFKKIEDLKNVQGIGEKKLEKIKKYITI